MPFVHPEPLAALRRVGRLLRDLHDAAEGFVVPPDAVWNVVIPPDRTTLVVHHDAAPWNLVTSERWVLIDWDNCGPGSRLWDIAYAAHGFVPLAPGTSAEQAGTRLAVLADGYGLDEQGRVDLCDLLVPRIMSMYDLLRRGHQEQLQPWGRLWEQGHGDIWLRHAEHTAPQLAAIKAALLNVE
jgi:Ser/Thr protein kinase RdoA (MazF antagonist)